LPLVRERSYSSLGILEWTIIGIFSAVIVGLISVIYVKMESKIDAIQLASKNGLLLKVDKVEYRVAKEFEQEIYKDLKITIKELRDDNNASHAGILLELKRQGNK
jgi:Na+-translocating ferredoxin:NAD+ oxidoreductase RnfG subunit